METKSFLTFLVGQELEHKREMAICGTLRNLVPFEQFKKRKKHPWRSINFIEACNFTKINTSPWVFFTFLKLYKWYEIAQRITDEGLWTHGLMKYRIFEAKHLNFYWARTSNIDILLDYILLLKFKSFSGGLYSNRKFKKSSIFIDNMHI